MRFFAKLGFRAKITLGLTAIIVCLGGAVTALATFLAAGELLTELRSRSLVLAENLALRAAEPLLAEDLLRLKNMADDMSGVEDVAYAFILAKDGRVLASTFSDGFPTELRGVNAPGPGDRPNVRLLDVDEGLVYDAAAPVLVDGARLGDARIGLRRDRGEARIRRMAAAMAGLSGLALVAAVVAAGMFADRAARRLNRLREHAENVVRGDLDVLAGPVPGRNCWEIMGCDNQACPAFGERNRRCWHLAGTLCPRCPDGGALDKAENCAGCPVYRTNRGDEIQDLAETFDFMTLALKERLTQLTEARDQIEGQERLLRVILDADPDHMTLLDPSLAYLAVNKALAEFLGRPAEEILGRTDLELFPGARGEALSRDARKVLAEGRPLQREERLERGGEELWFHVLTLPVRDVRGHAAGALRAARDVTLIKRYQERLLQAQKMESLGQLAGGVAHEINTPLGVILGYAQLLKEDVPQGEQMYEDLGAIEKQVLVCRDIVADLLKFSRRDAKRDRLASLNDALREAVFLVEKSLAMDGVAVTLDLDPAEPMFFGDPERLKQVCVNLLGNARDAMVEAGVRPGAALIASRQEVERDRLVVEIADAGPGIPSDMLDRIFEPFFTTKPSGKGTGLGLSVSFGIVKDHGGELVARSPVPAGYFDGRLPKGVAPGPGTLFTIRLPLPDAGRSGRLDRDEQETPHGQDSGA